MLNMRIPNLAHQILDLEPIFLDTETTGVNKYAEIVELAIIETDGQVLTHTLINPKGEVPANAVAVHGITKQRLIDEQVPDFYSVFRACRSNLYGRIVVAYNADYDLRMLYQSLVHSEANCSTVSMAWLAVVDAMLLFSNFLQEPGKYGGWAWKSLEYAASFLGVPADNRKHRALGDAELLRRVFIALANYKNED